MHTSTTLSLGTAIALPSREQLPGVMRRTSPSTRIRTTHRETSPAPAPLEDPGAFNAFVLQHQDVAYSVAYRVLGNREAAEDATQEAFLRAYRARASFSGGSARGWLMRIVANAAIDELRSRKRRPQMAFATLTHASEDSEAIGYDPPDSSPGPEAAALQDELRTAIEAALARLSDDHRAVVVLHDVHGFTYEEIAQIASVPVGTVRSRLSRARGQLRELLASARPAAPHATA
jgi:RNA polymerase sigma-70 factor, ECF subfamily